MKQITIISILFLFAGITSLAQEPTVNINVEYLDFGEIANGDSYVLEYTISAENLSEDLTISVIPGQGFLTSETNTGSNWSYSYSLSHIGGTISETTLYVRFLPNNEADYSTTVSHGSGDLTVDLSIFGTGIGATEPYIILNPSEMHFGTIPVGSDSMMPFDFTICNVDASETASIEYPVTSGFSNYNGGSYTSYFMGSSDENVMVLFTPTTEGFIEADVIIQGQQTGITKYLHVTATAIIPNFVIDQDECNFGEVEIDNPSSEFTYTIVGTTMYNDILIDAPYGFEISLTSGSNFTNHISLSHVDGNIEETQIFVRFAPQITTQYSGNIIHQTEYGSTQTITLFGNGVSAGSPIISISENNFEFEEISVGSSSEEQTYTVSGINLSDNITITAPDGFEISETSGTDFTNEIILIGGETIDNTNVFIRFAPQINQLYSGILTHVSSNATQKEITVSGNTTTGIKNLTEGDFAIYPNPSNGFFTIINSEFVVANIVITDIAGRTIYNSQPATRNSQFEIDISDQPKGIYLLSIETVNEIYTTKLIIQ